MKLKNNKKIVTLITLFSLLHAPLAMSMNHNRVHPEEIILADPVQENTFKNIPDEVIFSHILKYLDNKELLKSIKFVSKRFYFLVKKHLAESPSPIYLDEKFQNIFSHILKIDRKMLFTVDSDVLRSATEFESLIAFLDRQWGQLFTVRLLAEPLDHNLDITIKTKADHNFNHLISFLSDQQKQSLKTYKKLSRNKKLFAARLCFFLILSPLALIAQIIATPYLLMASPSNSLGWSSIVGVIETALMLPHLLTCISFFAFLNTCKTTKNHKAFFEDFFEKIEEFAEKNSNTGIEISRTSKI